MTSALAIVDTADDVELAREAGFERIALRIDATAKSNGSRRRDTTNATPTVLLCSAEFACGADPKPEIQVARHLGASELWWPLDALNQSSVEASASAGLRIVGTVTADQAADPALYRTAVELGLSGLLFTAAKVDERIVDRAGIAALAAAVVQGHNVGLTIAFAGGLEAADVPRLLALGADELGFDGAFRNGSGVFDRASARSLLGLVQNTTTQDATETWPKDLDRIFVRDWTVAMGIGVYARERGVSQRVRFNVAADVLPSQGQASSLAGIVSYDLITDAITRLTADHVDLVEQVAEGLAALVLDHPRVARVEISVEKLDIGPGSLGCRIVRARTPR